MTTFGDANLLLGLREQKTETPPTPTHALTVWNHVYIRTGQFVEFDSKDCMFYTYWNNVRYGTRCSNKQELSTCMCIPPDEFLYIGFIDMGYIKIEPKDVMTCIDDDVIYIVLPVRNFMNKNNDKLTITYRGTTIENDPSKLHLKVPQKAHIKFR